MSEQSIKSITIVGGGSSGWMTAAYLNQLYNSKSHKIDITLIESKDIGILGVGEATVHSIRYFFAAMGINEQELMRETQATYKSGIMFKNWMKPSESGETHEYFHPFEQQQLGSNIDIATAWLLSDRNKQERYDEGVCLSSHTIKHALSPKLPNSTGYKAPTPYGYHLDATQMARFLKAKCTSAGVRHVEATVTDISVVDGNIDTVHTEKGNFSADVFIDCTGFKGLLINKVSSDNWESFEEALPCNKAVAIQRKLPANKTPTPYTVATALSNGWVWQIDLANRQGTGYVYDGNRLTKKEAEEELKSFLGEESEIIKTTHIDMQIGRRKEFWVGNCICIGLSGGFIEPLESTGLHLINLGARLLSTHLTGTQVPLSVKDSYNRLMRHAYDDLKQFIVLHYCLTDRDDSEFWVQARKSVEHCPELTEKLALWRNKPCEFADIGSAGTSCFTDENYRYILYGMGYAPKLNIEYDYSEHEAVFEELQNRVNRLISSVMTHEEALQRINS
ncbi:tryptophan halogenase family protein [Pseudoalteromonas luteoviolacea]|uniref:Tryptophan halogenase n=1 Tax=Pseudoalteromonas luteoviolacea NCIMB 1942 TaxID=1365253 RepID=A0A167B2M3_9GAMM|nr:tryptophan halogenase family protein [Pseudoalteromonas luteoviolacea]KZN46087.1 hypothetical protein N482_02280 [Pseudoalteromonas luteoviolacea NCIMB 1942]KZW98664.1 tryptophan halogenase [Pseudoalteromonas luteoviolacea]